MRGSRPPNSGTILVYNSLIALTKRPPECNKCLNYLVFVEVRLISVKSNDSNSIVPFLRALAACLNT